MLITKTNSSPLSQWLKRNHWTFLILIISLVYVVNPIYFTSPPLHSDDWSTLAGKLFSEFTLINLSDRRPLISIPYMLLTQLFGLLPQWYYVANWLVIFITGVLVYWIAKKIYATDSWINVLVASFFLIYPTDFTKTWLVHFHAHSVLIIDLCAILLLIQYKMSGRIVQLLLANTLFIVGLLIYEAGLGIVMMASLVLLVLEHRHSKRRSLLFLTPIVTGIFFIFWRLVLQPRLFSVQDNYLTSFEANPLTIAYRYLQAFYIAVYNWTGPLLHGLGKNKPIFFLVVFGLVVGGLILYTPKLLQSVKSNIVYQWKDREKSLKQFLLIFSLGFLMWAAGYIPTIGYSSPDFWGDDSRFNLFSTMGAALMLVNAILLLVTLRVKNSKHIKKATLIALTPLLLLALGYQVWSQNERVNAWEIQKQFWNSTFDIVPNLKDNSRMVIVISGSDEMRQFEIPAFAGNWEARSALKVLYNNESLGAQYYYLDLPENKNNQFPELSNWAQLVIVSFDHEEGIALIVDDPNKLLDTDLGFVGYDPYNRITEMTTSTETYRYLVQN